MTPTEEHRRLAEEWQCHPEHVDFRSEVAQLIAAAEQRGREAMRVDAIQRCVRVSSTAKDRYTWNMADECAKRIGAIL